MPINAGIEKAILEQLDAVFPGVIKSPKEIMPEYKNRDMILDYLFEFMDQGWVKFMDLSSRDGKDCYDIRITRSGIGYLKTLGDIGFEKH
jgi:hypothetical protein